MLSVRVFFSKKGSAVYISHLDLQRAVARAINRSGLDAAYTEGFNPHLKLVFAMPLSLGQYSDYEIFDFATVTEHDYGEICEKLRKSFPSDLEIIRAAAPVEKLSKLARASYDIEIYAQITPDEIIKKLSSPLVVEKKTKSGKAETEITGLIYEKSAEKTGYSVLLHIKAACGPVKHLNAAFVCTGLGLNPGECKITRTGLYGEDGGLLI